MAISPEKQKQRTAALKEFNDELERSHRLQEEMSEDERKLIELQREKLELEKQFLEVGEAAQGIIKNRLEEIGNQTKALGGLISKEKELKEATNDAAESIAKGTQTFLDAALGLKSTGNAVTNVAVKMSKGAKGTDILKKAFTGAAGKALVMNTVMGISAGIMSKFAEATAAAFKTSEELVTSLGKQAGIASNREQINSLMTMSQNSADANVTFAALGKATADLQAETQGLFGNILTGQKELIKFSAEMTGLGVDTSTTAKLFGEFGSILGKDAVQQITKLERSTIKLARTFGMSANKMIADVSSLAEELAIYGDTADDVALGVTKIATVTKVSAGSILKFGQQFEFMSDAITKTNQLNRIIGKNVLNTREMFNMMNDGRGPAEALITTMDKIGPSLDENFRKSLPKMRGLFAEMGIGNKAAGKLANTYIKAAGAGRTFREEIDAQAKSAKENEKVMKPFNNLMEQLGKFQEKFAVALTPVVNRITSAVTALNELDTTSLQALMGGAALGGIIGTAFGGPVGGIAGTVIGGLVGSGVGSVIDDGVIVAQDGNISTTKINSADDVRVVAAKPGGPIANFGGSAPSPRSIELVVSLFGKELIRNMVDLVESEQSTRRSLQDSMQGA
tara:strand:+ start:19141 stop:21012 length:1872 start_codon:yes stop_codon:yes gene_type:complete